MTVLVAGPLPVVLMRRKGRAEHQNRHDRDQTASQPFFHSDSLLQILVFFGYGQTSRGERVELRRRSCLRQREHYAAETRRISMTGVSASVKSSVKEAP